MGSCLCKEKKPKSSRRRADSRNNRTPGSNRGNQTEDMRIEGVLDRSSNEGGIEARCRFLALGNASEDNNMVPVSSTHPPSTRLSSQSK